MGESRDNITSQQSPYDWLNAQTVVISASREADYGNTIMTKSENVYITE